MRWWEFLAIKAPVVSTLDRFLQMGVSRRLGYICDLLGPCITVIGGASPFQRKMVYPAIVSYHRLPSYYQKGHHPCWMTEQKPVAIVCQV